MVGFRFSAVKRIMLVFLAAALLTPFQNCARIQSKGDPDPPAKFGNGEAYDGKVYSSTQKCADNTPATQVAYAPASGAKLLKENCQILNPAVNLTASQYSIDAANPGILHYQGEPLYLEPQVPNTISFKQTFARWTSSTTAVSAANANVPVANGSLIVCFIRHDMNTANPPAVTSLEDSSGNSYTRAIGPIRPPTPAGQSIVPASIEAWYSENVTGAPAFAFNVTARFSNANSPDQLMHCVNYDGVATTGALQRVDSLYGQGTGAATIQPIPTTAPNELILAVFHSEGSEPLGGYVNRSEWDRKSSIQDLFTTSIGIYQAQASVTTTSPWSIWDAMVLTFRGR